MRSKTTKARRDRLTKEKTAQKPASKLRQQFTDLHESVGEDSDLENRHAQRSRRVRCHVTDRHERARTSEHLVLEAAKRSDRVNMKQQEKKASFDAE